MLVNMLSTQMTQICFSFLVRSIQTVTFSGKTNEKKRMQVKRCRDRSVHELFSRSKDKFQFSKRANTITRFCIKTFV